MNRLTRDYRWALFLVMLSGVLLAFLMLEWGFLSWQNKSMLDRLKQPAAKAVQPPIEEPKDIVMPGMESYMQMVDRPLFMDGRKPGLEADAPGQAEQPVQQTPLQTLKLMGVIVMPQNRLALLMDEKNHYKRVKVGEDFGGWTLLEIYPDHVVVGKGNEKRELKLLKLHKAAPPSPQPPPPPLGFPGNVDPPRGNLLEELKSSTHQ